MKDEAGEDESLALDMRPEAHFRQAGFPSSKAAAAAWAADRGVRLAVGAAAGAAFQFFPPVKDEPGEDVLSRRGFTAASAVAAAAPMELRRTDIRLITSLFTPFRPAFRSISSRAPLCLGE